MPTEAGGHGTRKSESDNGLVLDHFNGLFAGGVEVPESMQTHFRQSFLERGSGTTQDGANSGVFRLTGQRDDAPIASDPR